MSQQELNLGILAHVDAGKTTLTERLLFEAGVIDEIGSVDAGTTQTDSLALERQRGITIKSAVTSFSLGNVHVNLIDTPGHPDFIAEVERVLSVLDGAVLVISAVEGVQPQTRILMRALQRLCIPTLLFVNKIDRAGADEARVLQAISERLTTRVVPMGTAHALGTRTAEFKQSDAEDHRFRTRLAEVLAERDDAIMAAYVEDELDLADRRLRDALAAQTRRAVVHPVFLGAAITGAGVGPLMTAIADLLPVATGDAHDPVSATVFKIERGPTGEKVAYVRMFSGTIHVRDRLHFGRGLEDKVTAIAVFERGPAVRRSSVSAGAVARLWGLAGIQIGDAIGESATNEAGRQFPPPTLESVVAPTRPDDGAQLRIALAQLAEQDPLIDVRQDDDRGELSVSLYGEVQKEVIQATLADDFGIDVAFRETTPIYVERPSGTGEAVEVLHAESNPFNATIGLRVEPAAWRLGRRLPARGRPHRNSAVRLQETRTVRRSDGPVRASRVAGGPLRLAGDRLRRDDEQVELQRARRASVETGATEHGRRLPQAHTAGAEAGARTSGNGGLRAGRACQPRDPGRDDRRSLSRAGATGRLRAGPSAAR